MAAKKRKLWATQYTQIPGAQKRRHESKASVDRYVDNEVTNWLAHALRSQHLTVYVDERDGRGFVVYEQVDLDAVAAAERAELEASSPA